MPEDMTGAVKKFFHADDAVCIETNEDMELSVYTSMDEIIDGKIFLILYMKK